MHVLNPDAWLSETHVTGSRSPLQGGCWQGHMSISGRRSVSRRRIRCRRRGSSDRAWIMGQQLGLPGVLHALLRRMPEVWCGRGAGPFTSRVRVDWPSTSALGSAVHRRRPNCHSSLSALLRNYCANAKFDPHPAPDLAMGADTHVCCHAPRALASPLQQARVSRWSPCIRLGLLSQYRRPSSTNYVCRRWRG